MFSLQQDLSNFSSFTFLLDYVVQKKRDNYCNTEKRAALDKKCPGKPAYARLGEASDKVGQSKWRCYCENVLHADKSTLEVRSTKLVAVDQLSDIF